MVDLSLPTVDQDMFSVDQILPMVNRGLSTIDQDISSVG